VNVISKPGVLKLAKKHPETLPTLSLWYKAAKKAKWRGLHEVRREYPSADQVGDVLIFDVLGNNYRLMTRVEYNLQRIYVKALLNHREYDRKEWMKWA
jgi:mRNA interferase HigB